MRGHRGCPGLCNCQPITPTLWEGPACSKWHSTASAGVLGTKEGQKTAGSEQIAQGSLRQTRTVSTLMVHLFCLAGPRAIQTQPFPRKGSSKKRTPPPATSYLEIHTSGPPPSGTISRHSRSSLKPNPLLQKGTHAPVPAQSSGRSRGKQLQGPTLSFPELSPALLLYSENKVTNKENKDWGMPNAPFSPFSCFTDLRNLGVAMQRAPPHTPGQAGSRFLQAHQSK